MIEAVIPCKHGEVKEHRLTRAATSSSQGSLWCREFRRVRLVEVQPDYEAAWSKWSQYNSKWKQRLMPRTPIMWIVDAAVPGPTYRMEEVE